MDDLEKSWECLRDFDRSHFGRLNSVDEAHADRSIGLKQGDTVQEERNKQDEDAFSIPELPIGQVITVRIHSTWGDPFYVGLNGLQVFTSNGEPIKIKKLYAEPRDMRVVERFVHDPRVLENLLDGVYVTRDDAHLWMAPFESGNKVNYIRLELEESSEIAMIRVWNYKILDMLQNYNKSRIHSYRGVRQVEIFLDDTLIFRGEISKAPGSPTAQTEELSDTILFTTDEATLEKLAKNDKYLFSDSSVSATISEDQGPALSNENVGKRPATGQRQAINRAVPKENGGTLARPASVATIDGFVTAKGRKFVLELCQNWGVQGRIGLNGFQLIDRHGRPCILVSQMLSCNQRNCDPLGRLINDRNVTMDAAQIWSSKFDPAAPVRVSIRFPHTLSIIGLRVWNYNRSFDASYAGVQLLNVYAEDDLICRNTPLVKAPGNLHYDFYQDVFFGLTAIPRTPQSMVPGNDDTGIVGFIFQFQLLSTWGDEFYMGLNGIEIFDQNNSVVTLKKRNLAAHPESINALPGVSGDVRTSDKLIDGVNDTDDINHMWLTPVTPHTINRVYVIFDQPIAVTSVAFWNYTRTPSRGVRHVVILVDDIIVQSCEIDMSKEGKTVSSLITLLGQ